MYEVIRKKRVRFVPNLYDYIEPSWKDYTRHYRKPAVERVRLVPRMSWSKTRKYLDITSPQFRHLQGHPLFPLPAETDRYDGPVWSVSAVDKFVRRIELQGEMADPFGYAPLDEDDEDGF